MSCEEGFGDLLDMVMQEGDNQMSDRARSLDPVQRRDLHGLIFLGGHHHPLCDDAVLRTYVESVPL